MLVRKNQMLNGFNNKPILYDFFETENPQAPLLVYTHGFNGFKDWGRFDLIAEAFVREGFHFFKYNGSHNGTTPEFPESFVDLEAFSQNNYSIELYDLNACLNHLYEHRTHFGNFHSLVLFGHSRGGGISIIQCSRDNRVNALMTWASVHQCKTPWANWQEEQMKEWEKNGVAYYWNARTQQEMPLAYQLFLDYQKNEEAFNIEKAIASIHQPILMIHGTLDSAVRIEDARNLAIWQPKAEWIELPTDHVFGRKHPWIDSHLPHSSEEAIQRCIQFLRKHFNLK
jgi:alpha-beta hydrolase superfamily lysophospholipase